MNPEKTEGAAIYGGLLSHLHGALYSGPAPFLCIIKMLFIQLQETKMNWDQIQGKWKQSAGKIKEKWGKLTDDDLTTINGKREQLVGKIQERYGIAKDAAEKQVDEFTSSYRLDDTAKSAKGSY